MIMDDGAGEVCLPFPPHATEPTAEMNGSVNSSSGFESLSNASHILAEHPISEIFHSEVPLDGQEIAISLGETNLEELPPLLSPLNNRLLPHNHHDLITSNLDDAIPQEKPSQEKDYLLLGPATPSVLIMHPNIEEHDECPSSSPPMPILDRMDSTSNIPFNYDSDDDIEMPFLEKQIDL